MTRSISARASPMIAKDRHTVLFFVLTIFSTMLLRTEQSKMPDRMSMDYPLGAKRAMLDLVCPPSSRESPPESREDGVEVIFLFPRDSRSFLVAYCASFKKNCGKRAANAYCREMGFQVATAWQSFPEAGLLCGQTRYIRDRQRICSGESCTGFTYINCLQRHKE
ncbi:hypothetical protein BSKO_03218 [Bryopsis sp. KO-2023]|nr:hypothetical protein BSKO_03218 [Bryopsis sp. KO-2023]